MAATYSPALWCSTIGHGGLNCSVRNGKRWRHPRQDHHKVLKGPASFAGFVGGNRGAGVTNEVTYWKEARYRLIRVLVVVLVSLRYKRRRKEGPVLLLAFGFLFCGLRFSPCLRAKK